MDGGAWWAAVHGVAQSRTRLKRLHYYYYLKSKPQKYPSLKPIPQKIYH